MVEEDGWYQVAMRGSHRHFKHPVKHGKVTIPGKPGDDLHPKTWECYSPTGPKVRDRMRKYTIILEPGPNNWCIFSPDVSGCVSTGDTAEEALANFHDALEAIWS